MGHILPEYNQICQFLVTFLQRNTLVDMWEVPSRLPSPYELTELRSDEST